MDLRALESSLLLCPFCGSRGILERQVPTDGLGDVYFVRCSSLTCGCAEGICRHREPEYVVWCWNRRAAIPTVAQSGGGSPGDRVL